MPIVLFPLQKGQRLTEAIHPPWLLQTPPAERLPRPPGVGRPTEGLTGPPAQTLPAFCAGSLLPLIPKLAKAARQRRFLSQCARESRGGVNQGQLCQFLTYTTRP